MFINQLAHSEELHEANTSDLEHYLTEPFVTLPLFLLLLILLYLFTTRRTGLKAPIIVLIYLAIFFLVGLGLYSTVPAVSFISIVSGMALSLFFAFATLVKS